MVVTPSVELRVVKNAISVFRNASLTEILYYFCVSTLDWDATKSLPVKSSECIQEKTNSAHTRKCMCHTQPASKMMARGEPAAAGAAVADGGASRELAKKEPNAKYLTRLHQDDVARRRREKKQCF